MAAVLRIIVTRPAQQAALWVREFSEHGLHSHSFPLIEIAGALDDAQRQALHQRAQQMDVCMWVSSNAVHHFYQEKTLPPQSNTAFVATNSIVIDRLRHWATGPGTVAALQSHGVPLAQIDAPDLQAAQWDSAALWQRVAGQVQPGRKVLILRGEDIGTPSASREWLADKVRAAGGQVEIAAVYQRRAPQFSAAQLAWAQAAAQDGSVWLFSSSQALTHLPAVDGGWGRARCIVTHERIAQAAGTAGFAVVCTSRPALADVLQSIKSQL
jgi:uroporphyrinogen-III synthase